MQVEIDQSVKIEQTNRDTIIGLANDVKFVVAVHAVVHKTMLKKRKPDKILTYAEVKKLSLK